MKNIEKVSKQTLVINKIDEIQHSYLVDAGIMPFIRAVPIIGDMISTTTDTIISSFQEKKQLELINCITENLEMITSDMVNDVEFILNFAKTVEAVKRLATNDKVEYFGNLLRNGYLCGEHIDNNDFEEYSNIINELSFREITYLTFFIKNQNKNCGGTAWTEFKKIFQNEFSILPYEIYDIFTRLKRTGFIDEIYETDSADVDDNQVGEIEVNGNGFELTTSIKGFSKMVLNLTI